MAVHAAAFKRAASMFPSGVTVVTSCCGGKVHGITASAFSSVSLEPPQVLVCVDRKSRLHDMVLGSGLFAVSVLAEDQEQLSNFFASPGREPVGSFAELEIPHDLHYTGTPILRGSSAYFDCTLANAYDGGDHSIFLGDVQVAGVDEQRPPLAYFDRAYRRVVAR